MTEVKSLNVTADTYRHRGWLWRDRATYETFKRHMKLPLWIDRILTGSEDKHLFVVGKEDGCNNAILVGSFREGVRNIPTLCEARLARYNCNTNKDNGFRVIAERIRAKKPDTNKVPRPLWRQRMTKPWEPGTLGGKWVLDSKLVKEVSLNTVVPERADRLYISTSGGTDTIVWADSTTLKPTIGRAGSKAAWAKGATGIRGHQLANDYSYDYVLLHEGCHWQLAGVLKKTVGVPEPEVVKPTTVKPSLNKADIYSCIAGALGTTRDIVKRDVFSQAYAGLPKLFSIDMAAAEETCPVLLDDSITWGNNTRPPIGVKPRNLHDEERANALDEAMVRYLNEDLPFPIEWAVEWNELRARLNKEQK